MAIFRRDDPPAESPPPRTAATSRSEPVPSATRVAPGNRFEGQLRGNADAVVDGELAGEVMLDASFTVGARGRVEGTVRARAVRVAGELHGDVVVEERLEVLPGGRLEGDVRAPRVAIAEGGFFRGHIDMSGDRAATSQSARAGATSPSRAADADATRAAGEPPAATGEAAPSPGAPPAQTSLAEHS